MIKRTPDYAAFLEAHGVVLTQAEKDVLQRLGPVTQVDIFESHDGKLLFGPGASAGDVQHIQAGAAEPLDLAWFARPGSKAGAKSLAMTREVP